MDTVPAGGEILWVTYYFRDRALADALIRAHRRGVSVQVTIEGCPRFGKANESVRRQLASANGLGQGSRVINHRILKLPFNKAKFAHLHEKVYYFSHPKPVVLLGSFNPSGDVPENPEVVQEIGDQDRGHNVLVEISDPAVVNGIAAHARWLHTSNHGIIERFAPELNRPLRSRNTQVYFFPRTHTRVFIDLLRQLPSGGHLWVASSHLNEWGVLKALTDLSRRRVRVKIIAHHTLRRIPQVVQETLSTAGVDFRRYVHPDGLPMHNKFLLTETPRTRQVVFGSMNLTLGSRWLNHEILLTSEDSHLFATFAERWQSIASEEWTRSPSA